MMQKLLILLICLIPFFSHAQTDVLVLQRRGMHERAYTVGDPMIFKTVYGQWFSGTIEDLRHDTIYIAGQGFHYNEIAVIQRMATKINFATLGVTMMIAGGGFAAISAINGGLRQDHPNQWFTTGGYVIAGALLVGGFLLAELSSKYYKLGGRFKLTYLQITPDKPATPGKPTSLGMHTTPDKPATPPPDKQ
jgi:hypothetical protein